MTTIIIILLTLIGVWWTCLQYSIAKLISIYSNAISEIGVDIEYQEAYSICCAHTVELGMCRVIQYLKPYIIYIPLEIIIIITSNRNETSFLYTPPYRKKSAAEILEALQWRINWLKKKQWRLF